MPSAREDSPATPAFVALQGRSAWPAASGAEALQRYRLNGHGEPAASDEVEERARLAIEIVVLWRGDVLAVRHVSPPGTFYVGDSRSACDVALPVELLGAERLCIAVGSRSEVSAVLPAGARGWLALPDGSARPLERSSQLPMEQLLPLGLGSRAHLCFDGIELQVAAVAAGRAPARRASLGFDGRTLVYFGLSSLSVASLLATLSLMAPPLGLTLDERVSQERLYRLQSYLTASAERVLRQQQPALAEAPRSAAAAPPRSRYEPPAPHEVEVEASTSPEPLPDLEAPESEPRTAAERRGAIEHARSFGMIGLFEKYARMLDDPRLTYTRELRGSELAAMDQMFNAGPTWDEGPAGLALSGTGRRGGGRADVLPLEHLGTISEGQGTLPESFVGFGNPSGSHRTSTPELHASNDRVDDGRTAEVPSPAAGPTGRASPATVRRAINAQLWRIRSCHEAGLRTHPALAGEAVVSFILQPDGRAAQLSTQSSNLPAQVVSCIEGVFRELSLPQPSEPLRIVYPVQLAP